MNKELNKYKKYCVLKELGKELCIEDAVILKNDLLKIIQSYDLIEVDFKGIEAIPRNFFNVLLIPILGIKNRNEVYSKLSFYNMNNLDDFKRVYYGTTNI